VKDIIETDDAPAAVGAYSQATSTGSLVFTAGQIPFTANGDSRADAPITTQTELVLDNLSTVLEAAGCGLDDVVKVTIFLADIDDFEAMNETYADYFDDEPPARSAVQAGALPKDVDVEIEAIATVEQSSTNHQNPSDSDTTK
jgi:2-iminobutanoate/2-iminopropanoate deaminase